jgi:arylformamidase
MELDDAYANAAYIPGGADYPARWAAEAAAFRDSARLAQIGLAYGESGRQRYDLFHPPRLARGVVVFVHGGYWLRFDKSFWSHLAAGPLARGWAVAMPSYDLCPDITITGISQQIRRAIAHIGQRVPGPIRLVGHSAGGQIVGRIAAEPGPLQDRIAGVVPISPVADLGPLRRTSMNNDLQISQQEVQGESPLHLPRPACDVTIWVGGAERLAFLDQAAALGKAWAAPVVTDPERHHFNVIAALARPGSALTDVVLGVDPAEMGEF